MFATFKSFVKGIHNEFETTIKRVRSDNGSEFKNTRLMSYVMNLELDINSQPSTLHNQMVESPTLHILGSLVANAIS